MDPAFSEDSLDQIQVEFGLRHGARQIDPTFVFLPESDVRRLLVQPNTKAL